MGDWKRWWKHRAVRGARRRRSARRLILERLEPRSMLSASGSVAASSLNQPDANLQANAGVRRDVNVMTQNVYIGADVGPVISALITGLPGQIVPAVTDFWQHVQDTDFPERAKALARLVDESQPDLIGLQEVTLFRSGVPDSLVGNPTPATDVELDYLQLLLDALDERGLHYKTVAVTEESDVESTGYTSPGVLRDLRMTDRDCILARSDLPAAQMRLSNVQEGHYAARILFPVGATGQVVEVPRGWNSVDVGWGSRSFRFFNTHLETHENVVQETVQVAQAAELAALPVTKARSLIMLGDYNSPAGPPAGPTYRLLRRTGVRDAWKKTRPGDPGYTYGNEPDLRNSDPLVVDPQRIDLVLYRGTKPVATDRIGDDNDDRTDDELWPSDHAGVTATLTPLVRLHVVPASSTSESSITANQHSAGSSVAVALAIVPSADETIGTSGKVKGVRVRGIH